MDQVRRHPKSEQGSALLMTTLILVSLTLMISTCLSLASRQYDLALLKRNTSNTYYLSKSALEKHVDTMNKAVETQMNILLDDICAEYVSGVESELVKNGTKIHYNKDRYILAIDSKVLSESIREQLYKYLKEGYVAQTISGVTSNRKPIVYTVQGDRAQNKNYTEIQVRTYTTDKTGKDLSSVYQFRIVATAKTRNALDRLADYDTQTVEAIITVSVPVDIENQIYEKYEFYNQEIPEILKSPILCFSDIIVSDEGKLNVLSGDVRVSGAQDIESYDSGRSYPEPTQNGGIIALNGGQIKLAGNLYCTNSVLATNGWGKAYTLPNHKQTLIEVERDIIAYTVGIVDDYYDESDNQSPFNEANQAKHVEIKVGRNVMVDNDVMIGRWVKDCQIYIKKSLFGVSGGIDTQNPLSSDINPNQSSGVFAQGEGSRIRAERMYVAGQPYMVLENHQKPLKLWESIGEPFTGFPPFQEDVNQEKRSDSFYDLEIFKDFIDATKIETDFLNTYAVGRVSAINTNSGYLGGIGPQVGAVCQAVFGNNQSNAIQFFYQGGAEAVFSEFMEGGTSKGYQNYTNEVQNIMDRLDDYWGETGEVGYRKSLGIAPYSNYRGLKGYMTLMRSIFYQDFDKSYPVQARFSDTIKKDSLPHSNKTSNMASWSYETPICITNGGEVDISKFYVSEEEGRYKPYPTLIISHGESSTQTLKLVASQPNHRTFKGIIVSSGAIEIASDMEIEGIILIGGPESRPHSKWGDRKEIFKGKHAGLMISEATVNILYNPYMLTEITVKNHQIYRQILDALYLTDYSKAKLNQIMDKQLSYTQPTLKYSRQSILEIETKGVGVEMTVLRKAQ